MSNFLELASSCRCFIRNFNIIIAPLTKHLKGGKFHWNEEAYKSFELIKRKVSEALLALLNFKNCLKLIIMLGEWKLVQIPIKKISRSPSIVRI